MPAPLPIEDLLHQAIAAHQSGNFDDAQQLYLDILQKTPNQPDALALLGLVWDAQGKSVKALTQIAKAIRQDPNSALLKFHLTVVLQNLKRFSEAIFILQEVIKLAPQFEQAHYNLGNALREINDWTGAINAYRETLKIAPDFVDAYKNLALCLAHEKRYKEACTIAKTSAKRFPKHYGTWVVLGTIAEQAKDYNLALSAAENCIRLMPHNYSSWTGYAKALHNLNRLEEAKNSYKRATELNPNLSNNTIDGISKLNETLEKDSTKNISKDNKIKTNRPILLIYGNCHATAIRNLLANIKAVTSIFDIRLIELNNTTSYEKFLETDWQKVAVVLEQYSKISPLKYGAISNCASRTTFPVVDSFALWPFNVYDKRNKIIVPPPSLEPYFYGDQIIINMSKDPLPDNPYEEYLKQSNKAMPNLDRLLKEDKLRHASRERHTNVKISPYLFSSERYGPSFWSYNHSKGEIVSEILKQLFAMAQFPDSIDKENLWTIIESETQGWDPSYSIHVPIHPTVISHFNLPLGENTKYLYNGKYVTHREWVLDYLHYNFREKTQKG